MMSKTRLRASVTGHDWKAVETGLDQNPALLRVRDERGRNWLHLCCGVDISGRRAAQAKDSIRLADLLLNRGIDVNAPAFTEGAWKATPLWYAIGRGRNLALAKFLLERGADPNHCLWAAVHKNDLEAIRLVIRHGADVDPVVEGATPFLEAIKWSRFESAELLLDLGADVNYRDPKRSTALHYVLAKGSDKRHVRMLVERGARGDIPNRAGVTAAEILSRKRDPDYREMAVRLRGG